MRAFKIVSAGLVRESSLSKSALKRLMWFDWHKLHGENVSKTCRHFGISRDTFYLWKRKFNPRNLKSLEDDTSTRRPHSARVMTTSLWVQDLICAIRANDPEKSKYEIQAELAVPSKLSSLLVILELDKNS
ncbi:MAG: helix-turn-helix domain-containing protein [Patescibacteria group bacterium]